MNTTLITNKRILLVAGLLVALIGAAQVVVGHSGALVLFRVVGPLALLLTAVGLQDARANIKSTLPMAPDCPVSPEAESGPKTARALIVGANAAGLQLAESLEASGKYKVIGFVDGPGDAAGTSHWRSLGRHDVGRHDVGRRDATPEPAEGQGGDRPSHWRLLGTRDATAKIMSEYAVEEVFIAHAPTWQQQLAEEMTAECPNVSLHVVPTSYEAMLNGGRVTSWGDIAVVSLKMHAKRANVLTKRAFDLVAASLVLALFAPVWGLIALLIKLTSAGPVIFAQERIGLHGRVFRVFKFRTMRQNAEAITGPVLSAGKQDPRLTALGRYLRLFRIDEVPQFWNVMRGEMSLVGPRPERPVFVNRYTEMLPSYARRHEVKPGITGLAQVYGGYHTDGCDKLRFDLIYASHQSLWFDLQILLRTVLVIVMPDDKH
jgi:lipopolysaccharide/colanic/teichoic acid biosynthesis glycosyltransferase